MLSMHGLVGKLSCFLILVLNNSSLFALEIIPIESSITIINGEEVTAQDKSTIFNVAQSVTAPDRALAQIAFNQKLGVLSFSILSPVRAEMKVKWDNAEFMFPRFNTEKVRFFRPGATQQISFNVTKPMSGLISIYNSQNQLLKRIPYSVKKQRPYSQSLYARAYNADSGSNGDDANQSIGLDYSFSRRAEVGQPILRGGLSIRTELDDDDGHDDKSANVYIGVTW